MGVETELVYGMLQVFLNVCMLSWTWRHGSANLKPRLWGAKLGWCLRHVLNDYAVGCIRRRIMAEAWRKHQVWKVWLVLSSRIWSLNTCVFIPELRNSNFVGFNITPIYHSICVVAINTRSNNKRWESLWIQSAWV
jgi:hypothetical protein